MSDKEFTVSEVIDSFGLNAHTWRVFVLLACAMIFDGYDFMIVNSTNTYLAASFGVSGAAMGSPYHVGPARNGHRRRMRRYSFG